MKIYLHLFSLFVVVPDHGKLLWDELLYCITSNYYSSPRERKRTTIEKIVTTEKIVER